MATSAADWLTAIGTVGAVIVALGTPAATWLIRRARRPVLRIGMSGAEPNLRAVLGADSDETAFYWLRCTVTNTGPSTAQAVRAQVRRYWVPQADPERPGVPWAECAIDPQPLAWASRPDGVDPAQREAVPIPGGSSDLAAFASLTVGGARMRLEFLTAPYLPPSPPTSDLVEYRFEVSVSADNADLVTGIIWCERESGPRGLLAGAGADRPPPPPARTHFLTPRAGNPQPPESAPSSA